MRNYTSALEENERRGCALEPRNGTWKVLKTFRASGYTAEHGGEFSNREQAVLAMALLRRSPRFAEVAISTAHNFR